MLKTKKNEQRQYEIFLYPANGCGSDSLTYDDADLAHDFMEKAKNGTGTICVSQHDEDGKEFIQSVYNLDKYRAIICKERIK